jgi:hypothetical protein
VNKPEAPQGPAWDKSGARWWNKYFFKIRPIQFNSTTGIRILEYFFVKEKVRKDGRNQH